jgi:pimeloyl-ACP methyl ester carboxylesterase
VSPQPFKIEVSDELLADLHHRLRQTRWPTSQPGQGWTRGVDLERLRELCAYWADEFDWRSAEQRLNTLDQFTMDVNGLATHFIHVRSNEAEATPLLLTHGWPGSIVEFANVVGPLTDPVSHGGHPEDAFHVVCPSLPGYGFSQAPSAPGFDVRQVGRHMVDLMTALGYPRFAAQGGDWGAMATNYMALDAPEHLIGIHLNLVLVYPPPDADALEQLTERERARFDRFLALRDGGGHTYAALQGLAPHALAPALSDSPAGLAAWILEKFYAWTDHDGDVFSAVSIDEFLTNLMMYWVPNAIGSSIELYFESTHSGGMGPLPGRVEVPTGALIMPHDLLGPARAWADEHFNIIRWTECDSGGHFAALERPGDFVDDVRSFFRSLRHPVHTT